MASATATFYDAFQAHKVNRELIRFECSEEGRIDFLHFDLVKDDNAVVIHVVAVDERKRRKGVFTNFLRQVMADTTVKTICVCGVGSIEMIHCLNKMTKNGTPFIDQGGDFSWTINK